MKRLEPTWRRVLPLLIDTIRMERSVSGKVAEAELERMAEAADLYNAGVEITGTVDFTAIDLDAPEPGLPVSHAPAYNGPPPLYGIKIGGGGWGSDIGFTWTERLHNALQAVNKDDGRGMPSYPALVELRAALYEAAPPVPPMPYPPAPKGYIHAPAAELKQQLSEALQSELQLVPVLKGRADTALSVVIERFTIKG